jgi:hypothetical protein
MQDMHAAPEASWEATKSPAQLTRSLATQKDLTCWHGMCKTSVMPAVPQLQQAKIECG